MDGGSVAGTIFIVFLILKLTDNIKWSWWWVVSPLWIDAAVTAVFIILAFIILGMTGMNPFRFYKKFMNRVNV